MLDVDQIRTRLHQVLDLRRSEMGRYNHKSVVFVEGYVHELAHILDLGLPLDAAMDVVQSSVQVHKTILHALPTVAQRDRNEVAATAMTMLVLNDVTGYDKASTIAMLYDNLCGMTSDDASTLLSVLIKDPSTKRTASTIKQHLLQLYA
jgi:hypothetical protein